MNRRDFIKGSIKLLATIPALALLKSELPVLPSSITEELEFSASDLLKQTDEVVKALAEHIERDWPTRPRRVRWNGTGDSWESVDGGETWNQTGFRPTLEIEPDGVLYVSGNFLEEDIEQVRQRHYNHLT